MIPVVYAVPPPSDDYVLSDMEICAFKAESYGGRVNITDFSSLAPFMWIEGVKQEAGGSYLPDFPPQLIKTNASLPRLVVGTRGTGALESTPVFGKWALNEFTLNLPPATSPLDPRGAKMTPMQRVTSKSVPKSSSRIKLDPTRGTNKVSMQARLAERQQWLTDQQKSRRQDRYPSTSSSESVAESSDVNDEQAFDENNDF